MYVLSLLVFKWGSAVGIYAVEWEVVLRFQPGNGLLVEKKGLFGEKKRTKSRNNATKSMIGAIASSNSAT